MKIFHQFQNFLTQKYFGILGTILLFLLAGITMKAQVIPIDAASEAVLAPPSNSVQKWTIVIHGGAGGPEKGTMTDEVEKAYIEKLNEALQLGSKILESGGSSLEAVEAAVMFMEDCPLFNAGIGAVLNEYGKAELDAAIMDGRTGMAGAVAGVTTVKNPITAARLVMEKTKHVMLVGKGADDFAKNMGLTPVEPSYFITPERLDAWKKWKANTPTRTKETQVKTSRQGTVGAVALDQKGNLAAATSTGGMLGKMAGRVGDSPIIGAGTYANNNTCAVSATGQGEYFMRNLIAYDLSALMEYRGMPVEKAGKMLIMDKLVKQKASGGLIAIDKEGNIAMPFNTNAMFRGFAKSTGETRVEIY